MESAGLVIGVAGLTGAFSSCVECFDYIQLGRNFGTDYGKCLLRLDAAKLRLTRWGESFGLGPDHGAKSHRLVSNEEFSYAESLLEQIRDSFQDAEHVSKRYKKHASLQRAKTKDLTVYDPKVNLNPEYRRLHLTLRELAAQRQSGTSILKKACWALYEKKKFDTMIQDIIGFVGDLVASFPDVQGNQRALCRAEVLAIKDDQDLALLRDVVCEDDRLLEEEAEKKMAGRGHTFTDWTASNSKMRVGDENIGVEGKGHRYSRFSVSDRADVHLGNINRAS